MSLEMSREGSSRRDAHEEGPGGCGLTRCWYHRASPPPRPSSLPLFRPGGSMDSQRSGVASSVTFERRRAPSPASPLAVSVKQAAEMIGVSYMTLWRAIRDGDFPAIKLRDRILVPVKAVELMFQAAVETGALV